MRTLEDVDTLLSSKLLVRLVIAKELSLLPFMFSWTSTFERLEVAYHVYTVSGLVRSRIEFDKGLVRM